MAMVIDVYDGMFPSESKFFETLKSESSYHLHKKDAPSIIICNSDAILRKFPLAEVYTVPILSQSSGAQILSQMKLSNF